MAAKVIERSGYVNDDRYELLRGHRLSWGGIFAGAALSIGIWLLLSVMGLAFGLTSVDPSNPESIRNAGIGTGIWQVFVPLVSLFIGGYVASKAGNLFRRGDGAMHGAVLWAITSVLGFVLIASVLSSIVGGALKLGGQAVSGVAGAAGAGIAAGARADGDTLSSLGLSSDDLVAPINRRLEAAGKPTITAAQLQASMKDVIGTAVREGRFDRELLVTSIAQNTNLNRADSEEIARTVEQRFNERFGQAREKVSAAGERAQTGALQAADVTGKAFLGLFGAMFLGLLAAIGGAVLGARGDEARAYDDDYRRRVLLREKERETVIPSATTVTRDDLNVPRH